MLTYFNDISFELDAVNDIEHSYLILHTLYFFFLRKRQTFLKVTLFLIFLLCRSTGRNKTQQISLDSLSLVSLS